MKILNRLTSGQGLSALLALSVLLLLCPPVEAQRKSQSGRLRRATAPAPRTAFDRGYEAGYNDGYNSGKSDYNSKLDRDY